MLPMFRRLGLSSVALVGVVTMVVTGAGASSAGAAELDSKKLAKQVASTVRTAYPELAVEKIKCPKKIKQKTGVVAKCTTAAGGQKLAFKVTQTNRKGNVMIEASQAVITKAKAEEFVAANSSLPATVDCGPNPYLVISPGLTFMCTAVFGDQTTQKVTVSVNDVAGNVTITQVV